MEQVQEALFALQDLKYRDFQGSLMPTVPREKIIGVRTPALRRFAAQFLKSGGTEEFLRELPHEYYEEDNIHACLIEKMKDFEECAAALDFFLPYVDNWATCDMISPKVFKKYPEALISHIRRWISSEHTYTVRFGVGCLMKYYLDENFAPEYPEMVAGIRSEQYYIRMMQAWYFATALAKQYEGVLPYLTERRLQPWVHQKTIQKAVESYRITKEQKVYLKTLKIKGDF